MANTTPIVHKRTAVSGRLPEAANTSSTRYIRPGELSINLTDRKVHTSNGSVIFEVGSNLTNLNVGSVNTNLITGNGVINIAANTYSQISYSANISSVNTPGPGTSWVYTGSTTAGIEAFKMSGDFGSGLYVNATDITFVVDAASYSFNNNGTIAANNISVNRIVANGSIGTVGQSLLSNGSAIYWSDDKGYTGSAGYTGSQGVTGFVGSQGVIGFTGSQGATGFTGSKGDKGDFGGAPFEYKFNTSTTAADPGLGNVAFSNTNLSVATTMYIDFLDVLGANSYNYLQTIDDSSSAVKGTFRVQEKANTLNYADFSIIGFHSEPGSYFSVPIAWLNGATSFTNTLSTVVTFVRTGDRGDTGFTGSRGTDGVIGYNGSVGFTGSQGVVGFTGSRGTDGVIGYNGSNGFTGSQGVIGFTGSRGTDGVIGYNGSTGFTGSKGDLGYTGSKGEIGFTGSTGPVTSYVFDGGSPTSNYSLGPAFDCGGVL